MGGLGVRADLRPGARPGGPARRPVRLQTALPDRAQPVHAGQRGLRDLPERGRADHRAAHPRPRSGHLLPGDQRHHPAAVHRQGPQPRIRLPRRDRRRLDRRRAAARRAPGAAGRRHRRLALGLPGEPVHRDRGAPGRVPAAAVAPRSGGAPARLRRQPAARRGAAADPRPAGGGQGIGLARVELAAARPGRPRRRGPGRLGAAAGAPRRRAGHPGRAAARAPRVRHGAGAGAAVLRRVHQPFLHPVDPVAGGPGPQRPADRPARPAVRGRAACSPRPTATASPAGSAAPPSWPASAECSPGRR